jgi:hypothetical protein
MACYGDSFTFLLYLLHILFVIRLVTLSASQKVETPQGQTVV